MDIKDLGDVSFIQDFSIELIDVVNNKKIKLDPKYLCDSRIDYSKKDFDYSVISGYIIVNNVMQLEKLLDFTNDIIITVRYIDLRNNFILRDFQVISIDKSTLGPRENIKFNIQDRFSFVLSKTYKPRNFKDTSLSTILKEYLSLVKVYNNITFEIEESPIIDYINITGNIDFLSSFRKESQKRGYLLYQTRKSIVFKKIENIFKNSENSKFKYADNIKDRNYLHKILEYYILPEDKNKTKSQGSSEYFDPVEDKMKILNSYNASDIGISSKENDIQFTQGKQLEKRPIISNEGIIGETLLNYIENNRIEMYSYLDINDLDRFKSIDVILSGVPQDKDTSITGNIKNSGKYTILSISDKFFSGFKCVSCVLLGRFDNPKK